MLRRSALLALLTLCTGALSPGVAQEAEIRLHDGDTIRYTYTPLPQDTPPKKSFIRRIVDYFGESTTDRTFEKKIDFTFAGGPSYSKTTSLGIGVLAAGLYRLDRTDSITSPSDVSLYANVSITGFYSVGISGNNIFARNRQRLSYTTEFISAPRDFWGIGYDNGLHNEISTYSEKRIKIDLRYLREILPHTYIGGVVNFDYTRGIRFSKPKYLNGENSQYTATGLGAIAEYDSRDFIPNPFKGVYVSLRETVFPKGLGNCDRTLWQTTFTADAYQRVWKDCILAADLYAEFNSTGTPWPMLARLGDNQRMRGYYLGRFTDNNMITLQVELRQRIWRRIGGVIWGGAGNVFHTFDEFRWDQTLPNYGLGLRWELKKRVNVRLDYGFGKKTNSFLLNINEAF